MATGNLSQGSQIGGGQIADYSSQALSQTSISTASSAYAVRFQAPDSRDIYSVWILWDTVSGAQPVTLTIEQCDDLTGKPLGTPYDANATITFTPTGTGGTWQQHTFASHPATGLTPGKLYAIVIIANATASTSLKIRSCISTSALPSMLLSGTSRAALAEVANNTPVASFVMSDGEETTLGFAPYITGTARNVYGNLAVGAKFTLAAGVVVSGLVCESVISTGTPTGLRGQIFDSTGTLVPGATVTILRGGLLQSTVSRRIRIRFPAAVTLAAGTYYAVWDQTDHTTTSGNNYGFTGGLSRLAGLVPSGTIACTVADITATPPIFTPITTECSTTGLLLSDLSGGGGGGSTVYVPIVLS